MQELKPNSIDIKPFKMIDKSFSVNEKLYQFELIDIKISMQQEQNTYTLKMSMYQRRPYSGS